MYENFSFLSANLFNFLSFDFRPERDVGRSKGIVVCAVSQKKYFGIHCSVLMTRAEKVLVIQKVKQISQKSNGDPFSLCDRFLLNEITKSKRFLVFPDRFFWRAITSQSLFALNLSIGVVTVNKASQQYL